MHDKARYTLATKSNSTRSTMWKVDKVDRVALALCTRWPQSRKDVRHSGNRVDRISDSQLCRQCVPGVTGAPKAGI